MGLMLSFGGMLRLCGKACGDAAKMVECVRSGPSQVSSITDAAPICLFAMSDLGADMCVTHEAC